MGISLFGNSAGNYTAPNPNPFRYGIKYHAQFGRWSVLLVYYPDCTTYEGLKVLVVKDYKVGQPQLDPHFLLNQPYQVMARFPPTDWGLQEAENLARSMSVHD